MTHQRVSLRKMAKRPFWAWFWDMGTGKTKVELDNAGYLFLLGQIDALVHVAPMGAHRSFVEEQVTEHLSDKIQALPLIWDADVMTRSVKKERRWRDDPAALLKSKSGDVFPILSINIDAMKTDLAGHFLDRFYRGRRVMLNVDESIDIALPNDRYRAVAKWGKVSQYRRVQNGTPAPEGVPFHYYGQMQFLSPSIFGNCNFEHFKRRYAEMEQCQKGKPVVRNEKGEIDKERGPVYFAVKKDWKTGEPMLKNIDDLKERVFAHADRVLKDDVLDLPPRTYAPTRYFSLSREQREMYDNLAREFRVATDDGRTVLAELPIVRLRRLYQITRGYVGINPDEPKYFLQGDNPALDMLERIITEAGPTPTIIWTWEKPSAQLVGERLRRMGLAYVVFTGAQSQHERARAMEQYIRGDVGYIIGHPFAMGRSYTMVNTRHMIFYENDFRFLWRSQSEDRAYRKGLKESCLISDLVADMTVDDTKVIKALRRKHDAKSLLTGDPHTDWM